MAAHGILDCRIPRTEEPGGLQSTGSRRVGTTEVTWHAKISTVLPENMILKAEEQDACP